MPTGVYQSPNRRGGQKGRSGVYPKSKKQRLKISETLKRKGVHPSMYANWKPSRYWLDKNRSDETKSKISKNNGRYWLNRKDKPGMKGEKHWHWIEDRNQLVKNEKKHLDSRYKEWMCSVKNRDSWKCKINNSDCRGRLEAHHILRWVDYPELRYEINNGITLCHYHHPIKRSEVERLIPFFKSMVEVK